MKTAKRKSTTTKKYLSKKQSFRKIVSASNQRNGHQYNIRLLFLYVLPCTTYICMSWKIHIKRTLNANTELLLSFTVQFEIEENLLLFKTTIWTKREKKLENNNRKTFF